MSEIVKVSCVSYLNSVPYVQGLKELHREGVIDLSLDMPSACAQKVSNRTADIGLIPVAALIGLPEAEIITDYCIGADGPVKSVTLLSEVPLTEIKTIQLDYQSRTSVNLTKILAARFWKIEPQWLATREGFEETISGPTAGVVIGDRSLQLRNRYEFVYDLAGEWQKWTGLPFVFACWVTNKSLDSTFIRRFNAALASGLTQLDQIISDLKVKPNYYPETESYLKDNLKFLLTPRMREGMDRFLQEVRELGSDAVTG